MSIFLHELNYYIKNIKEAIYIYAFFISIIVMAVFGFRGGDATLHSATPALIWVALASAITLAGADLFSRDAANGRLEYYQLLPMPLEAVIAAKWLAFYVFVSLPLLLVVPLMGLLLQIHADDWLRYMIGLGLGGVALSLITSLASALMVGMGRGGTMLSLLVLPLSIPVAIFGSSYCAQSGHLWQSNLLFLGGFALFLLPILLIAAASTIRASN
jgi:heme exporter protein B